MSGIPDRIGRAAGVASAAGGAGGAVRATTDAPEPLTDWPLMVFQPNATSVEAGFFTWEVATGEVICDPGTYRMHGLPEATSASMDAFLSRVPESDLPDVVEAMKRMVASCGTYQIEYRVAREDGSLRCIEARGRVLPGPDGSPVRMMGVAMDTTAVRARREAEERRLREGADRARRAREFTAALASAVTVEAIVAAVRDGLHAYGADSLIMVAEKDGRQEIVAACGFDDETTQAFSRFEPALPTPISTAIQWRSPVYLYSPEALVGDYPHLAKVVGHSPQQAWVALPVTDSKGRVGACMYGFGAAHDFLPDERALLFSASGLLVQSLERARMYESEHALASELQRALLPRGKLTAPGVSIATRYQAATSGMEIGGDFYDVVELGGGRVALVIGDVQGHNLFAASLMGQLRTAVHAYAREGHGPAEVMARANQWLVDLNTDPDKALFATCCYVVLRPATGELAMCRAGHPPPVLVTPGAAPRILDRDGGLPLGLDTSTDYVTVKMNMARGSVLVLTTDGLLETDGKDMDFSVRCLFDVLQQGAAGDLETLADDLLGSPRRPPRHGDDVALLLARLDRAIRAES
ncbi:MAG TPA: SpoIIE family protein phosphatase [Streptosporangiaceae bacterium]|nr:SpoIIE family protein phosphatase [Streptosporangiaceae bacterium]